MTRTLRILITLPLEIVDETRTVDEVKRALPGLVSRGIAYALAGEGLRTTGVDTVVIATGEGGAPHA